MVQAVLEWALGPDLWRPAALLLAPTVLLGPLMVLAALLPPRGAGEARVVAPRPPRPPPPPGGSRGRYGGTR